METAADRKTRSSRRAGRGKREYFSYLVPRNRLGIVADMIGGDVRVVTTKKLRGFPRQVEEELSVRAFERMVGDQVLMVPATGGVANANVEVNQSAFEPDARARTILRGVDVAQADLSAAGGAYDLSQARRILHNISRQRIERRVQEGSLLAVPGPSNRRVYPTIQFNRDGTVVEGLAKVRSALGYKSPWSVLNFLINKSDGLDGQRPIDVLRDGDVGRVVEVARATGAQGL